MTFAFRVAIVAGVSLVCAIALHGAAQPPAPPILQEPQTILLWPNGAPGARGAIGLVRSRAVEWHLAADRIGVMGFSAGGHLASLVSTHFDAGDASATDAIDRVSSRPDFAILAYPVISFTESWTHQGSKT